MTTLTEKFTALETQLNDDADEAVSQRASILSTLEDIQTGLANINADMLAMKNALLGAVTASGSCNPCPTSPLMGTPPITDTSPIDDEHCQRVQALLHVIGLMCDYADAATAISIFTPSYINTAIDEIKTATSDSGIPAPGWIDAVTIAADGVNFIINRALLGGGAHASFDPLVSDLQSAIYDAGSPSDAKAAYDTIIAGSDGLAASIPLLKGLGYSDLFNYFLDSTTTPNLDGYEGAICGIAPGCVFVASQAIDASDPSYPDLLHRQMCIIPSWADYGYTFAGTTFSEPAVMTEGLAGGTITQLSGGDCRIVYNDGSNHSVPLVVGVPYTITAGNNDFFLDDVTPGLTLSGSWAIQYCPPEA